MWCEVPGGSFAPACHLCAHAIMVHGAPIGPPPRCCCSRLEIYPHDALPRRGFFTDELLSLPVKDAAGL